MKALHSIGSAPPRRQVFICFSRVTGQQSNRFFMSITPSACAEIFTSLPDGTGRQQVTKTPDNEIGVDWGVGGG
jgi:hypothetical protein